MTTANRDGPPVRSGRRPGTSDYRRSRGRPGRAEAEGPAPQSAAPTLPRWDGMRRLWLGRQVLREFTRVAPRQAALLAAFEARGWPTGPIPNPFQPEPGEEPTDARRHLRLTVQNLNRELRKGTIRFRDDGERVWWERTVRTGGRGVP